MVSLVSLAIGKFISSVHDGLLQIGFSQPWVDHFTANQGWRLMMILGILPALLTFFIRLFVPESEKWQAEQKHGATSQWATVDLLAVLFGALGPALLVYLYARPQTGTFEHTLLVRLIAAVFGVAIAVVGYTFPVMRYLQRIRAADIAQGESTRVAPIIRRMLLAACLSGVALLGTWGGTQQAALLGGQINRQQQSLTCQGAYLDVAFGRSHRRNHRRGADG